MECKYCKEKIGFKGLVNGKLCEYCYDEIRLRKGFKTKEAIRRENLSKKMLGKRFT